MKIIIAILLASSIAHADFTAEQQAAADEICEIAIKMISVAKKMEKEQRTEKISGVSNLVIKRQLGEQFEKLMGEVGQAFEKGQKLGIDNGIKTTLEQGCNGITKSDEKALNKQIKRITGIK